MKDECHGCSWCMHRVLRNSSVIDKYKFHDIGPASQRYWSSCVKLVVTMIEELLE